MINFSSIKIKKIFIILFIFIFTFGLRLWNLNKMGQTWDEPAYVEVGYKFIKLVEKKDFLNEYFYQWTDEPPLVRYVYGLFGTYDRSKVGDSYIFNYDYTFARLASSLIASVAVIVVVLFCFEFISVELGIVSGVILAMLPIFLGFSQIATLESFLFLTFSASSYSFLRLLKNNTYKNSLIAGIFFGLAILVKFTNLLLLPLFLIFFLLWKKYSVIRKSNDLFKKNVVALLTSVSLFFVLWPISFVNPIRVLNSIYKLRSQLGQNPSIEVFFGRLIHVPVFYYFVFFLITTPMLIIFLFFIGAKQISDYGEDFNILKKKDQLKDLKWIYYSVIAWFYLPFIQSFYNFRHHGVRFIFEIYAPLSIIAAMGFIYIANKLSKKVIYKGVLFSGIILYMVIIIFKTSPYYLDYFNEFVGGVKNVYEKGLFQIGWWGQGLREAGYYLEDNVNKNSSIALFISSPHVFPPLKNQKLIFIDPKKPYDSKIKYDYVVVNYFHVLREGFDDSGIKQNYKLIHQVKVDGASLVNIYKKK